MSADKIPALLPCPFCGEKAVVQTEDELSFVTCSKCWCSLGEYYDRSAWPDHRFVSCDEAAAAWNTRSDRARNAALVSEAVAGWRDISSAPKDGTDVLLGSIDQTFNAQPVEPRATVGRWTVDEECRTQIGDCGGECRCPEYEYEDPSWMSWDGGFTEENPPTHWMPLPTPPARTPTPEKPEGEHEG